MKTFKPYISVDLEYPAPSLNKCLDAKLTQVASRFNGELGGSGCLVGLARDLSFDFKTLSEARKFRVALRRFKQVKHLGTLVFLTEED